MTDTSGLLSATGLGISGSGTTKLTITGSLDLVNADLATLSDTDPAAGSDAIQLSVTDGLGGTAAPQTIAVTSVHVPAPDLVITSISAPAQTIAGQAVQVSWTLQNIGDATANGPWQDNVYIASDAAGDNPQLVGTFQFNGPLAPGQSATETELVSLPTGVTGNQWFVVKADPSNQTGALSDEINHTTVASAPAAVTTTIDWTSLEASARPPSIDTADWTLIWDRFVDLVGTTTASLENNLSEASLVLTNAGMPTTDTATLLGYELEQATGVLPNITLASTSDLADSGTGLDLSLTRTYSASFLNRNNRPAPLATVGLYLRRVGCHRRIRQRLHHLAIGHGAFHVPPGRDQSVRATGDQLLFSTARGQFVSDSLQRRLCF